MDTNVRTPQDIFIMPQRLLVPLFQRPYVWNQEVQWGPLWKDLERVSNRLLENISGSHQPHFLGAVVLQQVQNPAGDLQQRTIIDGQQRLTTLQILMDAIHAEISIVGANAAAARLEAIIENSKPFQRNTDDKFKVLPTNRDRDAFNEVMAQPFPIDYSKLANSDHRLVKAHKYFSYAIREWLQETGKAEALKRAEILERSVRELLQIVVIDLNPFENAQEIFETLNARGSVLTAADLIKNFVFQRLLEDGSDVEKAYEKYWANFESGFWEEIVTSGRTKYQRSSLFINQWLVAKTKEEIVARDVFNRFKTYADFESDISMPMLLEQIHKSAVSYKDFIDLGNSQNDDLSRLALFSYRLKTMELDGFRSILISLLDPNLPEMPDSVLVETLEILESWLVRRLLVRATTNAYNKVVPQLIELLSYDRQNASTNLRKFLVSQTSDATYWPDDQEVRSELTNLKFYRRIYRNRARMIFEAIEDHLRGWNSGKTSYSGSRIRRGTFAIEHLMPQSWALNWPTDSPELSDLRDKLVHTLGNLSLLTKGLNSKASNQSWNHKAEYFREHDLLKMNQVLLDENSSHWDEAEIQKRTQFLINQIIDIWPVPQGHKSSNRSKSVSTGIQVSVSDLIAAGLLEVGQSLFPKNPKYAGTTATVLADGNIEVDGNIFQTPSGAAISIRKMSSNGWVFWTTDQTPQTQLRFLRDSYLAGHDLELEDDSDEEPDDSEED